MEQEQTSLLMKPIPEDMHFAPAHEYLDMMVCLRETILAFPEQVLELKQTLN